MAAGFVDPQMYAFNSTTCTNPPSNVTQGATPSAFTPGSGFRARNLGSAVLVTRE